MKTSITYKRVLSLVAMLLLVALPAMAFAAPELTATADKTSVTAGDTVVVTVTLAGKKLSAAEGEFSYDPSLLTFTEGDGGASDGRIALVSAEKDGASSLSARITFTAAGAGEAKVDFNITKALSFLSAEIGMFPQNTVDATKDEELVEKIEKMLERFDDDDDVQDVYHNATLPEEEEEE